MRSVLAFLVIVALAAPAAVATSDAPPLEPDVLYLLAPEGTEMVLNLTTYPPQGEAVGVTPFPVTVTEATWSWRTERVPSRWSVAEGSVFRVSVQLAHLEKVVPVVDATTPPDAFGKLRVRAGILQADALEPVFSASTFLDPALPGVGSAPVDVTFEIHADRNTAWSVVPGEAPSFGVQVVVYGRMAANDPVQIRVGATGARVEAPGFPVEAFRAWEVEKSERAACNARILQGEPCIQGADAPVAVETSPGPGAAVGFVAALALAGAAFSRRP